MTYQRKERKKKLKKSVIVGCYLYIRRSCTASLNPSHGEGFKLAEQSYLS